MAASTRENTPLHPERRVDPDSVVVVGEEPVDLTIPVHLVGDGASGSHQLRLPPIPRPVADEEELLGPRSPDRGERLRRRLQSCKENKGDSDVHRGSSTTSCGSISHAGEGVNITLHPLDAA